MMSVLVGIKLQPAPSYRHGCRYPVPWTVSADTVVVRADPVFHFPVTGFRHPCRNDGVFNLSRKPFDGKTTVCLSACQWS